MVTNRNLLFFEGIILLLLGLFAVSQPYLVTLSIELMLGWILVVAGCVQGYRALKAIHNPLSVPLLIGSAFSLIAGILLLAYPLSGVLTLTLVMTVFLTLDGIAKVISGFQFRPIPGWGWLTLSGVLSLVLAVLIFKGWPSSAAWLIGLYVGIYWVFLGTSLLMLGYYSKRTMI